MGGGLKCKRGERRVVLECEKLIIAAGVNSIPKFPENLSWSGFSGLVMHSKSIGANQSLLTSSHIQRVTVVGGNKSAVDVVFLCAKAVKVVDWVISPDGYGPGICWNRERRGARVLRELSWRESV
jgi:dimethylaniline monooxygenase (N-oxide forming)